MSAKKTDAASVIWAAVRTGGAAVPLTLVLLFPMAALIRQGAVSESAQSLLAGGAAFLAAAMSALAMRCGRKGGIGEAAAAALFAWVLLLIISAGLPGGTLRPAALLPVLVSYGAGTLTGSLMQINKKYRKHHKKR